MMTYPAAAVTRPMPKRHEIVTDDGKCLDFSRNAPLGNREPMATKSHADPRSPSSRAIG